MALVRLTPRCSECGREESEEYPLYYVGLVALCKWCVQYRDHIKHR